METQEILSSLLKSFLVTSSRKFEIPLTRRFSLIEIFYCLRLFQDSCEAAVSRNSKTGSYEVKINSQKVEVGCYLHFCTGVNNLSIARYQSPLQS